MRWDERQRLDVLVAALSPEGRLAATENAIEESEAVLSQMARGEAAERLRAVRCPCCGQEQLVRTSWGLELCVGSHGEHASWLEALRAPKPACADGPRLSRGPIPCRFERGEGARRG